MEPYNVPRPPPMSERSHEIPAPQATPRPAASGAASQPRQATANGWRSRTGRGGGADGG